MQIRPHWNYPDGKEEGPWGGCGAPMSVVSSSIRSEKYLSGKTKEQLSHKEIDELLKVFPILLFGILLPHCSMTQSGENT